MQKRTYQFYSFFSKILSIGESLILLHINLYVLLFLLITFKFYSGDTTLFISNLLGLFNPDLIYFVLLYSFISMLNYFLLDKIEEYEADLFIQKLLKHFNN